MLVLLCIHAQPYLFYVGQIPECRKDLRGKRTEIHFASTTSSRLLRWASPSGWHSAQ
jgi:hypothetical protein